MEPPNESSKERIKRWRSDSMGRYKQTTENMESTKMRKLSQPNLDTSSPVPYNLTQSEIKPAQRRPTGLPNLCGSLCPLCNFLNLHLHPNHPNHPKPTHETRTHHHPPPSPRPPPQAGGLTDLSRWLSEARRATPPENHQKKTASRRDARQTNPPP